MLPGIWAPVLYRHFSESHCPFPFLAFSNLLGGSKILLIGNVIEQEFTQAGNWHLGSGLSIVLMIFIVINIIAEAVFDKRGEEAAS